MALAQALVLRVVKETLQHNPLREPCTGGATYLSPAQVVGLMADIHRALENLEAYERNRGQP